MSNGLATVPSLNVLPLGDCVPSPITSTHSGRVTFSNGCLGTTHRSSRSMRSCRKPKMEGGSGSPPSTDRQARRRSRSRSTSCSPCGSPTPPSAPRHPAMPPLAAMLPALGQDEGPVVPTTAKKLSIKPLLLPGMLPLVKTASSPRMPLRSPQFGSPTSASPAPPWYRSSTLANLIDAMSETSSNSSEDDDDLLSELCRFA
eukprot:EG_transcript_17991